jgi:Bacteriophage HK97-gp10, putative tail-component
MAMHENVEMFAADLRRFSRTVHVKIEDVVRAVVFELLKMIVVRTPVDTGRAAGSWMVRGGETDSFVLPDSTQMTRDDAVTAVMARVSKVDFSNPYMMWWIFNNLPYIASLEYGLYPKEVKEGTRLKDGSYVIKTVGGFSKQAPAGMVRLSIAELEVRIESVISGAARGGQA